MATNLVKWWKTRFMNGYKQFTVLMPADSASESGRPSDTEELLSSMSAPMSQPPHRVTSSPAPTAREAPCCCGSQAESTPRRELKFEEFECDVAVQGEDPQEDVTSAGGAQGTDKCRQCGPPRQEFSFTLYDLDGHGKITKDDIAGLVTTIYETLGATIQVPHTGSKTIRVRLTVAPENKTANNSPQQSPLKPASYHKPSTEETTSLHKLSCTKESLYHNLSPSKLANNAEQLYSQLNFKSKNNEVYYSLQHSPTQQKTSESVHQCSQQHTTNPTTLGHKVATVRVCNNESCYRLLNNEERLCDVDATPHLSPKPSVRFCNNETAHHISPLVNNVDSPLTTKKLSNDNSRREKNSIATPKTLPSNSTPNSPLRVGNLTRASVSSPRTSGRKLASHSSSPARSRRRTSTNTAAAAATVTSPESLGAGRERAYSGTLQRQELLHIIQANMEKNLLALHHNTTHHRKRGDDAAQVTSHSHHRHHSSASQRANPSRRTKKSSTSHVMPRKTTRTTVDPTNNVISCSHYYLDLAGLESANLCPHCDKGKGNKGHTRSKSHDTTTHHLLRHKTRELDHARAMAQVVEWLQGASLGTGGSLPPPHNVVQEEEEEEEEDQEEAEAGPETRTHRHIHEHVHHHYHHYTDSQLVV